MADLKDLFTAVVEMQVQPSKVQLDMLIGQCVPDQVVPGERQDCSGIEGNPNDSVVLESHGNVQRTTLEITFRVPAAISGPIRATIFWSHVWKAPSGGGVLDVARYPTVEG